MGPLLSGSRGGGGTGLCPGSVPQSLGTDAAQVILDVEVEVDRGGEPISTSRGMRECVCVCRVA